VAGGQKLDQLELGVVRVLELVDQEILETPLVGAQHVGPRAQQAQHQHDLIAEVHAAVAGHQLLVPGVGGGQLALLGSALPRRLVVGGGRRLPGQALDAGLVFGR
jgi:hypothetical protein